ncbi:GlsB/YeaQ/YmgE family stress response membrane protein [Gordonia sp. X0973]|uniref:GlsB/YeaQ/YmgE family stress response membrane protein n=1 Tax=Gordonia sp. X0973 TaxID=2742602 RepID=UPI0015830E4B|nr:GlsB/YeaQ/YmgE family stress response membrane protein [Gordonia sp. X0973]QKT08104.1 GlsB/YeaQ/YmgE family stress response membrane protein [Gordonia sp. X0973]
MDLSVGGIIGLIVFGAVIGVLARVVMPGKQSISALVTIVLGVLGAVVGYFVADKLGVGDTSGVDWMRWAISVAAAVLLTFGYEAVSSRSKS